MRKDVAVEFPGGQYRDRTADYPDGTNFLDFLQHVRAVMRGLVRHAPEVGG